MSPSQKPKYLIDGKPVFSYLFAHVVIMPDGRRIPNTIQVEGFSKDHAWKRVVENWPNVPRSKIEFIDYLEPEHDVGYLGEKLPLFPNGVAKTSFKLH